MPFGTACCAIEMMASAASNYDLARFGMERMSFSPRQADVLICAGRVPYKLAPVLRRIWDQMPQPKWSISMGACASSGGVFDVYSMVQGIDTIIPVDVYIPGCPPRPEGLIYGLMMIQEKIRQESLSKHFEHRAEDPLLGGEAAGERLRRWLGSPARSVTRRSRSRSRPASSWHPPRPTISLTDLMADEQKSGLDAVDEGPIGSDAREATEQAFSGDPSEHPSVAALLERFGDEVQGHRVAAGDQWVLGLRPARSHEILDVAQERSRSRL